jgi:hypothetical protein
MVPVPAGEKVPRTGGKPGRLRVDHSGRTAQENKPKCAKAKAVNGMSWEDHFRPDRPGR